MATGLAAADRLALQFQLAAVRGQGARGDRHQGGLARPVLAEQGMDLAGLGLEGDSLEGVHAVEALPYVSQPEHLDTLGRQRHDAYSSVIWRHAVAG